MRKQTILIAFIGVFVVSISSNVFPQTNDPVNESMAASRTSGTFIPQGTRVFVKFTKKITSKRVKAGEYVEGAVVNEDVVVEDRTVISADTPVRILVTDAKKGRQLFGWRGARLALEAVSTRAVDDTNVPLRFERELRKEGSAVATYFLFAMEQKIKPGEIRVTEVRQDVLIPNKDD